MSSATGPLPRFTREFLSADQTIAGAAQRVLAHGLGVVPRLVQLELVCLTAQLGYAINDVLLVAVGANDPGNQFGTSVVVDATNITVRYGAGASVFGIINKTTGAYAGITAANWALRVRAFA